MDKTINITAGSVLLLLLLVFSMTQMMDIRTTKALDSATMWGTSQYENNYEREASEYTCDYIYDRFVATNHYDHVANAWGPDTQQDTVYSTVWYFENYYDFATVFYKGHTFFYDHNGHRHYFIYDNEGGGVDDRIVDITVHDQMDNSIHDFVFLWSCFVGDEIGSINGAHSQGMPASWLDTTSLSLDGYVNPDNSDHCFIGFRNVSLPFVQETDYQDYNYGDFCRRFYYYALNSGAYTLRLSLYYASYNTLGCSYLVSPLYEGYWWYEEGVYWYSRMEVYGDGNFELPD